MSGGGSAAEGLARSLLRGGVPWRRQALGALLGLAVTACRIVQGLLMTLLVDGLAGGEGVWLPAWGGGLAVAILLRSLLLWAGELVAGETGRQVAAPLRDRLFTHLAALGPAAAARWRAGDLQAAFLGGVEALEHRHARYRPAVVDAVLGCGLVLAVLACVDPPTALLLGLCVAGLPLADRLWLRWRMPSTSGVFAAMAAFGADLLDNLQGIVTLKAFGVAGTRRAALAGRAADLRRRSMATLVVTLMRGGIAGAVTLGGAALVLSVNGWRTAAGELAPLDLFATLFLAREAFRPLERLEREFHIAWAAGDAVGPMADFLAAQPAAPEPARPRPAAMPIAAPIAGDIAFEAVGFAYSGATRPALQSLTFAVRDREFVALAGPSGAGKSTVASLLLRVFDPASGVIRLGGTDIRRLPLATLRSRIALVPQDVFLFHGSVEDNLRLARPDASPELIRAAAADAHIDAVIRGLPDGYATMVGERGARLSGGQRQRLGIARALLTEASVLILDEATSSLDPVTEQAIQAALDGVAGRRTVIAIAHRPAILDRADRVLRLDGGRLDGGEIWG